MYFNRVYAYIFFLGTFFIVARIYGQTAPSPTAIGAMDLSTNSSYQGVLTESVDIGAVTSQNGYSVPVNLVYQTKGVRVQDIASSVGLGWNLSAGGAITRVMRDEPDDQSTFYQELEAEHLYEKLKNHVKGYDYQKDIFYISTPSVSARFISDESSIQSTTNTKLLWFTIC